MPKELFSKFDIAPVIDEVLVEPVEFVVLYGEGYKNVNEYVNTIGGTVYDLGYGYGIVTIKLDKAKQLALSPDIQYIEYPKSLYLADSDSNRAACVESAQKDFGLEGSGVVIGFIDSGIDFTHSAFKNEDGTSRIKYIYDLSSKPYIAYDNQKINEALKARDPYSIVPVEDILGHGTNVAGIACAGGNIDKKYYGVAPKSSIMMVKSGRGLFSLSSNIMKGLKFLVDKSKELKMPLVVNISLSSNDGAHNGSSLLEKYISAIADSERISIVVAAGNEGDAAHHVGGEFSKENRVSFNVEADETAIIINLYKSILVNASMELISPAGASTGQIILEQGYKEGVISRNKYQIYNTGPKPFDVNGEIGISLVTDGNYILSGQWTIILRMQNSYLGVYDMWLPVAEGLNKKTKFLKPTIDNTLGIPATVRNVISVGSYNYRTQTISSFSGRGAVVSLKQTSKPELVAPGERIVSSIPGGSYDSKTGTSMAAPHVSGIAALIMEWGIIKGNDPYLFGERLKYYLIIGAMRNTSNIIYPDNSWGYGEVCAYQTIEELIGILDIININNMEYGREYFLEIEEFSKNNIKYNEYNIGELFIRIPQV